MEHPPPYLSHRNVFTRQVTCGPWLSHRLESTSTTRSQLTYVHCESVMLLLFCFHGPHLFELMKMGWERRRDGRSATRGARVRVELPNEDSVLSEPSKTSDQGPAATSIVLPEGKDWDQTLTSRTPVGSLLQHTNYDLTCLNRGGSLSAVCSGSYFLVKCLITAVYLQLRTALCVVVAACMAHSLNKKTATPMIHCRDSAWMSQQRIKPGLWW